MDFTEKEDRMIVCIFKWAFFAFIIYTFYSWDSSQDKTIRNLEKRIEILEIKFEMYKGFRNNRDI